MDKREELIEIIMNNVLYIQSNSSYPNAASLANKLLNWHTEQMKDYIPIKQCEEEHNNMVDKLLNERAKDYVHKDKLETLQEILNETIEYQNENMVHKDKVEICPTCEGEKKLVKVENIFTNHIKTIDTECPICQGKGIIF